VYGRWSRFCAPHGITYLLSYSSTNPVRARAILVSRSPSSWVVSDGVWRSCADRGRPASGPTSLATAYAEAAVMPELQHVRRRSAARPRRAACRCEAGGGTIRSGCREIHRRNPSFTHRPLTSGPSRTITDPVSLTVASIRCSASIGRLHSQVVAAPSHRPPGAEREADERTGARALVRGRTPERKR
jgi:hypothetical protein